MANLTGQGLAADRLFLGPVMADRVPFILTVKCKRTTPPEMSSVSPQSNETR